MRWLSRAAFVWAGYSRRVAPFRPCAERRGGGLLPRHVAAGGVLHLATERTVWPDNPGQWAALALLGLGPAGAAFFLWDHGVKRGDIRLLGVLSYAAPVLSTLWLVAAGQAEAGWPLARRLRDDRRGRVGGERRASPNEKARLKAGL